MHPLRVKETKFTSRNAFITDIFKLAGEKNQNMVHERSFGAPHGVLTYLLTLSLRKTHLCVLPDYFNFIHFCGIFLLDLKNCLVDVTRPTLLKTTRP